MKRAKWGNLKYPDLRDGVKEPPRGRDRLRTRFLSRY